MKTIAAQVLVCALEGQLPSREEEEFFKQVPVSGVTLFGRNIDQSHHDGVLTLTHALQNARTPGTPPLFIAIDQEGGRVARLKPPFPNLGPAMGLADGNTEDPALRVITDYAFQVGKSLAALGINVNFAPVVDILTEPENHAIGDRAFGTTPETVSLRAGAFLDGLQKTGVKGCLKHFPGQGHAKVDTHIGTAIVEASEKTLLERELIPFRALLQRTPMVMVAHCIYPSLAPEEASRSATIMQDLLRRNMGFQGVIVSDDMTMGALPQDESDWKEAILEAIQAGADLLLICRHLDRFALAHQVLTREAQRSVSFAKRLENAASRVMAMRQTWA